MFLFNIKQNLAPVTCRERWRSSDILHICITEGREKKLKTETQLKKRKKEKKKKKKVSG